MVGFLEVFPAASEAPDDVPFGYVMAALADSGLNPAQRQIDGAQVQVDYFDAVAGTLPCLDSARVRTPAEGGFECKIGPFRCQPIDPMRRSAAVIVFSLIER